MTYAAAAIAQIKSIPVLSTQSNGNNVLDHHVKNQICFAFIQLVRVYLKFGAFIEIR